MKENSKNLLVFLGILEEKIYLTVALINFLKNAFRHISADSIICLQIKAEYGSTVFAVSDNGGGLSNEQIE